MSTSKMVSAPVASPQSAYFDAPLFLDDAILSPNLLLRHDQHLEVKPDAHSHSHSHLLSHGIHILEPLKQPSKLWSKRDSGIAHTASIQSFNDAETARSGPRELTMEEEISSVKVRGLYGSGINGGDSNSRVGSPEPSGIMTSKENNRISMISGISGKTSHFAIDQPGNRHSIGMTIASSTLSMNEDGSIREMEPRGEYELAGGLEDWQDVESNDIDRYGFIVTAPDDINPKPKGHQRTPTALLLKSNQSRKEPRHKLQALILPVHDDSSVNMLTSPPQHATERMKARELKRIQKWRSMARTRHGSSDSNLGGGMSFEFDATDSKLASRTWKGIPDCWRAAAWHSFLSSSAQKRGNCLSDRELTSIYHNLLSKNNADDVQIDLDVPRTINSHIMFRKRYRGGQRLLFRVLHAVSLHLPEVGYVQGMASLAATFLCYYEEDMAFVMMVRLFELRGLDRLYSAGFGGLMNALNEFQGTWLNGTPVGKKLDQLNVPVVSYGTRWYLTLFNYSLPFAAQLRIWDVFMLFGDSDLSCKSPTTDAAFGGMLDVLHAASSALVEGMKDILIVSDFEDAMKVLTGWIPIKDEDLLMKIMRTEWKKRKRRHNLGSRIRH